MNKRFLSLALCSAVLTSASLRAAQEVQVADQAEHTPLTKDTLREFSVRLSQLVPLLIQTQRQAAALIKDERQELTPIEQADQAKAKLVAEKLPEILVGIGIVQDTIKEAYPVGWKKWAASFVPSFSSETTPEAEENVFKGAAGQLGILKLFISEFFEKLPSLQKDVADDEVLVEKFTSIAADLKKVASQAKAITDSLAPEATVAGSVAGLITSLFNLLK